MKKIGLFEVLCVSCIVYWASAAAGGVGVDKKKVVTFCNEIAPILQKSCQECHRAGGIAPMSLETYEEVRPWARDIQEKVVERLMPPFYAAGEIGRFVGDVRLTDEEIAQITAWVKSGAPRGNPKDLPPPRHWTTTDWVAGKPDLVLTMPRPFKVRVDQKEDFAFFVLDHVFQEDTWIRGIEVRPGNRRAVHHANVYLVPSEIRTLKDGRVNDVFDPVTIGGKFVTAWNPGSAPLIQPAGIGTLIPKGSRFGIQMHYVPSEEEAEDQTSIGFYLAEGLIIKRALTMHGGTTQIRVPAGESNYSIVERRTFGEDSLIRAFTCHMHLRGKSFAVILHYPDGRTQTAFDVPRYDVHWQQVYVLEKPIRVPKGTVAEFIAAWDNSAGNRYNPDPTKTVLWGDRTIDEMMDGYLNYASVSENLNIWVGKGIPIEPQTGLRQGLLKRR